MDDSTQREELAAPTNPADIQGTSQQLTPRDPVEDQAADEDERVYVLGYN